MKWAQDRCNSWEPRGNILDDKLVATFKKHYKYKGFSLCVEVLRTRTRKGNAEYLLRCIGHLKKKRKKEDWWVLERHTTTLSTTYITCHVFRSTGYKYKRNM